MLAHIAGCFERPMGPQPGKFQSFGEPHAVQTVTTPALAFWCEDTASAQLCAVALLSFSEWAHPHGIWAPAAGVLYPSHVQ